MLRTLFSHRRGQKPRKSRIPEGQRVYAVGDIHGRRDLLQMLHTLIAEDASSASDQSKTIIYLGDYIDRGMDSRGVIDCLLGKPLEDMASVFLMGNHEETILRFLDDPGIGESWCQFGGDTTLYSYGVQLSRPNSGRNIMLDAQLDLRQKLPETHLAFLRGLDSQHRIGDYFFVHAGIRPGVPLDQQATNDLYCIREEFLTSTADHGAVVVHGHSINTEVEDLYNRINIDTGAYASNVLTCLVLEGGDHWLLQTS